MWSVRSCAKRKMISPRFGAGTRRQLLVGRLRRRDGAVDVLGARLGEDADRVAVRGVRALERLAGDGVHPLAADEVLVRLGAEERHEAESSRGRGGSRTAACPGRVEEEGLTPRLTADGAVTTLRSKSRGLTPRASEVCRSVHCA